MALKKRGVQKICHIDDDFEHLKLFKLFLQHEEEDIQIDSFIDAKLGLREILEKNYTLVITDINMPLISGLDLVKMLRNLNYQMPIIIYSSDTFPVLLNTYNNVFFLPKNEKTALELMANLVRLTDVSDWNDSFQGYHTLFNGYYPLINNVVKRIAINC